MQKYIFDLTYDHDVLVVEEVERLSVDGAL